MFLDKKHQKPKTIIFVTFDHKAIKYECFWKKMQKPKTIIFVTLDDETIKYERFWIKKNIKSQKLSYLTLLIMKQSNMNVFGKK